MTKEQRDIYRPPGLWNGQGLHFIGLALGLVVVWAIWRRLGSPLPIAFWTAVFVPIAHQIFVWLSWRLALQNRPITGFQSFLVVFFILFVARFISLIWLGWQDKGTLGLAPSIRVVSTLLLLVPGLYAMYSVRRYFGMARAAGADHFDPAYRNMPMVNKGIFRFTSNGMYLYAFLLFWAIAIGFNSGSALLVAAFSHCYIWLHYYATEKPDMDYLYG